MEMQTEKKKEDQSMLGMGGERERTVGSDQGYWFDGDGTN